jgi:hypothetical protein
MKSIGEAMAETTNEMNMPIISASALGVTGDIAASMTPHHDDAYDADYDDIAIGAPAADLDCKNISVYANSITPVSYGAVDTVAAFDIVFSVGVNCGDSTKTYQVVKRIGIDKSKLAATAQSSMPVSIVEAKSAALKEEAAATAKRFRRLAGLE